MVPVSFWLVYRAWFSRQYSRISRSKTLRHLAVRRCRRCSSCQFWFTLALPSPDTTRSLRYAFACGSLLLDRHDLPCLLRR